MIITRYRCPKCGQCPEEMTQISPGKYFPTAKEERERPFFKLEKISHEEYLCKCGKIQNWYSLEGKEEVFNKKIDLLSEHLD